ncbi:MAG: hypothetical protein OXF74_06415 [Rhodobacteraceae bacterium]|nr:hypothetical protein [Paracoccaceae bacterium]
MRLIELVTAFKFPKHRIRVRRASALSMSAGPASPVRDRPGLVQRHSLHIAEVSSDGHGFGGAVDEPVRAKRDQ